jgi:hypothetical protein
MGAARNWFSRLGEINDGIPVGAKAVGKDDAFQRIDGIDH